MHEKKDTSTDSSESSPVSEDLPGNKVPDSADEAVDPADTKEKPDTA